MATEQSTSPGSADAGFLRSDPTDWISDTWKTRLWVVFIAFWIVYILAPPIMLVLISVDSAPFVRVPQSFSLFKYELMFQSEALVGAIERSLLLAVITGM